MAQSWQLSGEALTRSITGEEGSSPSSPSTSSSGTTLSQDEADHLDYSKLLSVKMPREIITVQVGQCGNQIGCRFWDMALREHASCNSDMVFDHALSSFFHNVDRRYTPPRELSVGGGNTPIHFLKARAVLVDMEEGVINQLFKGSLSELFDSKQYITGASGGSGNNWAQAHEVYGPEFSDAILEKIRGEAELCDSLQTFVMMHSIGGGTGSGVGSYILELLHDAYPEVYRFTQSIFPSADDDVITSPYNSLLSTMALTEHADCVLPVENQALLDIIRKKDAIVAKNKPNPAAERWSPKVTKPYDEMNSIASNLLLHLTCSVRFEGPLNVDLNEITMNLVPFPRLHYLVSSMSPHSAVPLGGNQQRAINQLFTDVFTRETQLMKVNPTGSTYLACALLMRGNNCNISDLQENVARMKHRLTMTHWNVEGFKVGLCSQPAVHSPCSLLCLANNTCIRSRFIGMKESFKQLYKRKVYVHHYTEYMDMFTFDIASNMLDDLIEEYETLETAKPPERITRLQPVTEQL